MANPFGDAAVTSANPFGDTPVTGGNPFGDEAAASAPSAVKGYDPREDDTKMFSDPQALLQERSAADPSIAPSKPVEQFSLGAAHAVNAAETYWLTNVKDQDLVTDEDKRRTQQLQNERRISGNLLKDIQAEDVKAAQLAGQAVQALPGSLASLALAPVLPMAPAITMGLGMNFVLEQTSNTVGRMDEFGQAPREAALHALPDSVVATGLEMLPMGAVMKYMKGAAPLGKTLMRVGGGESLQEGGTTLFQDVHTNLEGRTNYGAGKLFERAGESAAVGAMMAPMMGPFAGAAKMARTHSMLKEAKAEQQVALDALKRQIQEIEAVAPGVETRIQDLLMTGADPLTAQNMALEEAAEMLKQGEDASSLAPPMRRTQLPDGTVMLEPFVATAEDEAMAAIQRVQMQEGADWEGSPEALLFGEELQAKYGTTPLSELGEETPDLADEGGMSPTVTRRRLAEFNPNLIPLVDKPIAFADDPRAVGLTLKQAGNPGAGTITAVGAFSEHFPAEVYEPVMDLLRGFVQQYMPEARVVLDLSILPPQSFGKHRAVAMDDGSLIHVITPMDMLNMGRHQVSDPRTAMSLLSSTSHEMGHALLASAIHRQLNGALPLAQASALFEAAKYGDMPPELIGQVSQADPIMGRLLTEWTAKRNSILAGKMTANEFVDSWAGLRKLGFSVARKNQENQSLYRWAGEQLGTADAPGDLAGKSAKDMLLSRLRRSPEYRSAKPGDKRQMEVQWLMSQLNFHEYMAEQFSRAAYQNDAFNKAKFGPVFATALKKLREMFIRLKSWKGVNGEKLIQPSTTFQEWLVAQTAIAQTMGWTPGNFSLAPAIQKKQQAIAKKALVDKDKATQEKVLGLLEGKKEVAKKKPPEQVAAPKEVVADQVDRRQKLNAQVELLEEDDEFKFPGKKKKVKEMYELLERAQYVEVEGMIAEIYNGAAEMDRDYTSSVLSRLPDKRYVKRATLEATYKRQDVKAAEQRLWAKFLEQNPTTMEFTPAELETALLANALPLELVETAEYSTYGVANVSESLGALGVTTLFLAPYPTVKGESEHFREYPNYVAHIRSYTEYTTPLIENVIEAQSDVFQTKPEKWIPRVDETIAVAGDTVDELESGAEYFDMAALELQNGMEDEPEKFVGTRPEDTNLLNDFYAAQHRRLLRAAEIDGLPIAPNPTWEEALAWYQQTAQAFRDKAGVAQQQYSDLWLDHGPLVMQDKLKDLRPTWHQRMVREFLSKATERGSRLVRFATADTIIKVEGWPTIMDVQKNLNQVNRMIATQEAKIAGFTAETPEEERRRAQSSLYQLLGMADMHEQDLNSFEGKPVQRDYLPIYNFYKREMQPWLLKTFSAEPYTDRNGNTWLEVKLAPAMEQVAMFDTDNPFADRNPRVQLDQYAGLTAEQLRDPKMLVEAEAGWEKSGVESPIFKRWFGESKVTLGGKPRKVWGNGSSFRVEGGRVWTLSSGAQNPARTNKMDGAATRGVAEYYLRMENPKLVWAEHLQTGDEGWNLEVEQARLEGHDGLVLKHMSDPVEADQFVVFAPEQMARSQDNSEVPLFEYDTDSPGQTATAQAEKVVAKGWNYAQRASLNLWAKIADNLVQLQQVAATETGDYYLQRFVRHLRGAEKLKNILMGQAEDTVKDLMSIGSLSGGNGAGPEVRQRLHKALQAEWKSGELQGTLVGLDENGEVVWGGETGGVDAAARSLVFKWEIQTGIKLRKFLASQGVDASTEAGQRIEHLYLRSRNVFLQQFQELGNSLKIKAAKTFASNPLMQNMEREQINQLILGLMQSPFVPAGHFGNYVLVVKRNMGPVKPGERAFKTVRKQHFESQTAFDIAFEKAQRAYRGDANVQVQQIILKEADRKLPMQLPLEFMQRIVASGEFSDTQVDLLGNLMQLNKYDKIVEKYDALSVQLEGGNEDFGRVFSDFTWHNANYIWKMRYRMHLNDDIALHRKSVQNAETDLSMPLPEMLERSKRLRRTQALMEHQMSYVLEPPEEYQNVRGYISLAYLAYGGKTAMMNLSTNLNTLAALTYEYGEGQGAVHYGRALKNFWTVYRVADKRRNGEHVELTTEQQTAGLEPMVWAMGQALDEGIIDQSFAYFLAGQANSEAFMRATQTSTAGQLAHKAIEVGMMPFQAVERFNRIIALLSFFSADMAEVKKTGLVKSLPAMYEKAAKRVDQTQNAYDAANRPMLFQGRKALFTMFMSYVQFQTWVMSGGIDKAIRADIQQENVQRVRQGLPEKKLPSMLRDSRTKLWMVYLLLAGPLGLPFAGNILDLVRWLWRKLYPTEDIELTLRDFIKDMGADPNLVLHGVAHNVGGFDVSASLGLGRVIPGTDLMNKNFRNAEEFIGGQVKALGGPAGGFYESVVSALILAAHGEGVEALKALPGAIGAVTKSIDAYLDQTNRPTYGVTARNGKRMTKDLETGEYRDLTTSELVGMALGANPTMLSVNREAHYRTSAEILYWNIRRSDLMDKHRKAVITQDGEGRTEVMEAVTKFNGDIPDRGLRLTAKDLNDNLRMHKAQTRKAEKFGTDSRMYRGIGKDVQGAYGLRED